MDYRLQGLPSIDFNVLDWRNVRVLQATPRLDCHAAFTVTQAKEIWPFSSLGNSSDDWKFDVRTWVVPLDKIADEFFIARGGPGRFMISRNYYAYWKEEELGPELPFAVINLNRILAVPKQS